MGFGGPVRLTPLTCQKRVNPLFRQPTLKRKWSTFFGLFFRQTRRVNPFLIPSIYLYECLPILNGETYLTHASHLSLVESCKSKLPSSKLQFMLKKIKTINKTLPLARIHTFIGHFPRWPCEWAYSYMCLCVLKYLKKHSVWKSYISKNVGLLNKQNRVKFTLQIVPIISRSLGGKKRWVFLSRGERGSTRSFWVLHNSVHSLDQEICPTCIAWRQVLYLRVLRRWMHGMRKSQEK